MISVLLNSGRVKELSYMEDYAKFLSAKLSEDEWSYHVFSDVRQVIEFLLDSPLLDIVCIDVTLIGGIDNAKKIRSLNENTLILLIADAKVSPMSYLCPDIMAASLLLRPFTVKQLQDTFSQTFKLYMKKFLSSDSSSNSFVIDNRDGRQLVPYERIAYFESRDKKVVAATDSVEYSFYDTLDNLEQELPKQFLRCHRSFLINTDKIDKIMLSQSVIILETGDEIPLSRSYKSVFKQLRT